MSNTAAPPVMFRAGTVAGTPAVQGFAHAAAVPAASSVLLADISVFQPDIADAVYLAWSKGVVFRALYGTAVDKAWYGGARRDGLHAAGARFVGIYGYLRASQDAAVQAHALVNLVGNLRPREKLICDAEEGPANQQAARWRQWSAVITAAYGKAADPWLYSGLSFSQSAGMSPQWVTAYRATEPAGNHLLWQFSDAYPVPGVGTADCNRFRGSIDQLAAHGWQAAPVKPPVKPVAPPVKAPVTGPDLAAQQLPELRQGDTGAAVAKLQSLLTKRGFPAATDGIFGSETLLALQAAQRHYGLVPDGVAGPLTYSALGV